MRKKGFTLIELLAVIVILAIIALIATPIILNIISDTKEESNKRSVELYGKAVEQAIAKSQLNGSEIPAGDLSEEFLKTVQYSGNAVTCTTNKLYEDGKVKLAGCNGNYTYGIQQPVSFSSDSWETIADNVKAGNLSKYKVGDTKEIALTGYTNRESNSKGLYTVRIANTTTEECKNLDSQSACGFVIEFVDIITHHNMNPSGTYKGVTYNYGWNKDGWPASEMYKFLNDTTDSTITSIYESLPQDLQKVIKPTQVVSSHGKSDSSNFTSEDKLYLLSTKEVWGSQDTSNQYTRQLDYYKDYKNSDESIGVTTSKSSGAIKKYNGTYASSWSLRSAHSYNTDYFYIVGASGGWGGDYAYHTNKGVAPAFRIG